MQRLKFNTITRSVGAEPVITINTNEMDRDGDIVEPSGCVLDNYRRNPTVLWAHDYSSVPIGVCTDIAVSLSGIRAQWRWLEHDELADRVRNAFEQGVVNAASVGFKVLASEPLDTGGYRFTKWELLEFSLVPVPANAGAVRTLKALNLWPDDEVVLELEDEPTFGGDDVVIDIIDAQPDLGARWRGHHTDGLGLDGGALIDVDPAIVRAMVRRSVSETLRDLSAGLVRQLPQLVADETARTVRRMRGRLD